MSAPTADIKRKLKKIFAGTVALLIALFGCIYLYLRHRHCGGGICDETMPLITKIFLTMAVSGFISVLLSGWVMLQIFAGPKNRPASF